MADPTLGRRILDAAFRWAFDRALCGIEVGRESEGQLRALCARADDAERGMVARIREISAWLAWADLGRAGDGVSELKAARLAEAEHEAALAAWRAITKGGVTG